MPDCQLRCLCYLCSHLTANGQQAADLDVDDVTWFGPETITIAAPNTTTGVFRHFIYVYNTPGLNGVCFLSVGVCVCMYVAL
jgi:uncharacterized protein YfaP (DUF2135 family)